MFIIMLSLCGASAIHVSVNMIKSEMGLYYVAC